MSLERRHDQLGDTFAALDAEHVQRCLVAWAALLIGVPSGVVAIDGKTVRLGPSPPADNNALSSMAHRPK